MRDCAEGSENYFLVIDFADLVLIGMVLVIIFIGVHDGLTSSLITSDFFSFYSYIRITEV